jgi:hypothetical protein
MKQGYTPQEEAALLKSIEGLDMDVYEKKIDRNGFVIVDGQALLMRANFERAVRFATPRYYATEPELTSMFIYEVKIKDRLDDAPYFQVTIEASELEEINSKVRSILSALNSNK